MAAMLLAGVLFLSCEGRWPFEDVNSDPHPPAILNLQFSPMSIVTGDTVSGSFTYFDQGADIETLSMRDLNGSQAVTPTPVMPETDEVEEGEGEDVAEAATSVFFFPGTTGTTEWELIVDTNQAGIHTFKLWLEDSRESRSEPVFFDVLVTF